MIDGQFVIALRPTRRKEIFDGVEYRVFAGETNTGIELEMLGLFRVRDPHRRVEFASAVCSVEPGDALPVQLLGAHELVSP